MNWLRKLLGVPPLVIECGTCRDTWRVQQGERQQLYIELWDSQGRLYDKWAVGEGEMLDSRPVDFALLRELRVRVATVNAFRGRA